MVLFRKKYSEEKVIRIPKGMGIVPNDPTSERTMQLRFRQLKAYKELEARGVQPKVLWPVNVRQLRSSK